LITIFHKGNEVDFSNKELICLVQKLSDHLIFTPMAQRAEILLFLLFEYQHIIAQLRVCKQSIDQQQIFSNVIHKRIRMGRNFFLYGRQQTYVFVFVKKNRLNAQS